MHDQFMSSFKCHYTYYTELARTIGRLAAEFPQSCPNNVVFFHGAEVLTERCTRIPSPLSLRSRTDDRGGDGVLLAARLALGTAIVWWLFQLEWL